MPACQRCLPWPCQLEFLLTGSPVNLAAGEGQASPLTLCLDLLWEGPGLTHLSASPRALHTPGAQRSSPQSLGMVVAGDASRWCQLNRCLQGASSCPFPALGMKAPHNTGQLAPFSGAASPPWAPGHSSCSSCLMSRLASPAAPPELSCPVVCPSGQLPQFPDLGSQPTALGQGDQLPSPPNCCGQVPAS